MNPRPWLSARNRRDIGITLILALLLVLVSPTLPARAGANLVANGGLESVGADGFPVCWEKSGWGDSAYTFGVTTTAHTGTKAMQITLAQTLPGDRKAMMLEDSSCAPNVAPGHQYDLGAWYTTTTPNTVMTVFRHDVAQGWVYWTDLATLPVSTTYKRSLVRTPVVPPGTDQIVWGITIYGAGTLRTDDYTMEDVTQPSPGTTACTAGSGLHQGGLAGDAVRHARTGHPCCCPAQR